MTKVLENTLENFVAVGGQFDCYQLEKVIKKELTGNDYYYLRYCLMDFIKNNKDSIWAFCETEENQIFSIVDNEACFQDNELYIGSFEGYDIDENIKLYSIFLNENNRAILSTYNDENEEFLYYLID